MAPSGGTTSLLALRIGLRETGGGRIKDNSGSKQLVLTQSYARSLSDSGSKFGVRQLDASLAKPTRLGCVCHIVRASNSKEGQPNAQEGQPKTRRRDTILKERVGRKSCRRNTKAV